MISDRKGEKKIENMIFGTQGTSYEKLLHVSGAVIAQSFSLKNFQSGKKNQLEKHHIFRIDSYMVSKWRNRPVREWIFYQKYVMWKRKPLWEGSQMH